MSGVHRRELMGGGTAASTPPGEFDGFSRALETVLGELIDMALAQSLAGPRIEEMVRAALIDRAIRMLESSGLPATPGRIAVATGLPRIYAEQHLERRRRGLEDESRAMRSMDQAALVLNAWHTIERFALPYGGAADLPLMDGDGARPSFRALVKVAAPEAEPQDILARLVVSGCVQVDAAGEFVRCLRRELIVPNQRQNAMSRMGRYASALIHTYLHNIESRQPPYFERTVVSDQKLGPGQRDDVLNYVTREGQAWLVGLDEWIARTAKKDYDPNGKRYGVGLYFFEVPTDKLDDAQSLEAAAAQLNLRTDSASQRSNP